MRGIRMRIVVGLLLGSLAAGPICCGQDKPDPRDVDQRPIAQTERERKALLDEIRELEQQSQPFTQLFQKTIDYAMPAVVSISTTRTVRVRPQQNPFEDLFPFGSPFGNPWERQPGRPQPREREFRTPGLGSGFVVDAANGWVVTNAHVVADVEAKDIKVVFSDNREVVAERVAADTRTDIAVVKIPPQPGMAALEWAEQEAERGKWVIALGSPMGLAGTVTAGIVSAPSTRQRVLGAGRRGDLQANVDPYAIEDYIQTDAAINPGNSGGPLVLLNGRVVGLNTLIISTTASSAGLGFAVPTRIARPVVEALIRDGRVVRGHMGVSILSPSQIDDDVAKQLFRMDNANEVFERYGIKRDDEGALVASLMPNGPADRAGIREGDLITTIGDQKITGVDDLRSVVSSMAPGAEVRVRVMRQGRERRINVKIGEQPTGEQTWAAGGQEESVRVEELGLTVQTLTPEMSEALGYPEDTRGVIVVDVEEGSVAARAGLQRNDIVLQVGRRQVGSVGEFRDATSRIPPQGVALLVRRGDSTRFVTLRPQRR